MKRKIKWLGAVIWTGVLLAAVAYIGAALFLQVYMTITIAKWLGWIP